MVNTKMTEAPQKCSDFGSPTCNSYFFKACMGYEGGAAEFEDFPKSNIPVWLLGKKYNTGIELEELRADVRTKIWMTYRKNFPQIGDTGFTTDKGWGCMLRCGQMVISEALLRINLGREWRWTPEECIEVYLKIISLFEDNINQPFSIHQIVQLGVEEGKQVGEWYGPNTIAQVLKKLTSFDIWSNISVNVVMDNMFIMDEIRQSSFGENGRLWRPLVIFIPLRLGVSETNPLYISGLKKCFKMSQSLGIIGGKPNHALYFIGFMGEEIVYLDPHTTHDYGKLEGKDTDESKLLDLTYHCNLAQRMPFEFLDPSLALSFVCPTEKAFGDLCNQFQQELIDGEKASLFELYPTRPPYLLEDTFLGAAGFDMEDHTFSDDDEFEVLDTGP